MYGDSYNALDGARPLIAYGCTCFVQHVFIVRQLIIFNVSKRQLNKELPSIIVLKPSAWLLSLKFRGAGNFVEVPGCLFRGGCH